MTAKRSGSIRRMPTLYSRGLIDRAMGNVADATAAIAKAEEIEFGHCALRGGLPASAASCHLGAGTATSQSHRFMSMMQ